MKKLILGVAFASLVVSCKKVQAGGNVAVLKMEEGATKYSDEPVTDKEMSFKSTATKSPVLGPEMNSNKTSSALSGEMKKDSLTTSTTSATTTPTTTAVPQPKPAEMSATE